MNYKASEAHLLRAERTIPLGSQTFSKSRTQYPVGISPLYATRGDGAYLWDIDGNRFIDLVSALASITLGYNNKKLNKVVCKQLGRGVSLSLPGLLESEVSELLVELVPSAEMVRFGKNGSDVTSAAIRLARAYTGREHVAVCGYHGWQDWFIGTTTRNKGVPIGISNLSHSFAYNDLELLQTIFNNNKGNVAAVILEPMNSTFPNPGFLESVKEITKREGAVLIFDETVTGFRFAKGGAQEYFGVVPDLSTFGKGMASGFPISAVVGKREIMKEMENIFFSGTFGGELISLAAAKHVLQRYREENITERLNKNGDELASITTEIIVETSIQESLELTGHPSWKFLMWKANGSHTVDDIKTLFLQECFKHGLLVLGTHNVTLSHNTRIIERIGDIYRKVFSSISNAINNDSVKQQLSVPPLKPLFKIR